MALFNRKPSTRTGVYYDKRGRLVDPGADRGGWECARCGSGNNSAAPYCGCGADARLAAIR